MWREQIGCLTHVVLRDSLAWSVLAWAGLLMALVHQPWVIVGVVVAWPLVTRVQHQWLGLQLRQDFCANLDMVWADLREHHGPRWWQVGLMQGVKRLLVVMLAGLALEIALGYPLGLPAAWDSWTACRVLVVAWLLDAVGDGLMGRRHTAQWLDDASWGDWQQEAWLRRWTRLVAMTGLVVLLACPFLLVLAVWVWPLWRVGTQLWHQDHHPTPARTDP